MLSMLYNTFIYINHMYIFCAKQFSTLISNRKMLLYFKKMRIDFRHLLMFDFSKILCEIVVKICDTNN